MNHQLLPPKDFAPRLPAGISACAAVHVWLDLMKSVDKLVMAGFRSGRGAAEAQDAYRRWFAEQSEHHGRHVARLAKRLRHAGED